MQVENVNLNNLRVFECVYRTECMTKAAKQLHLTQSGVSQHIKALEDSLEVRLFDRLNKKIMPTREGEKLYVQAREALQQIETALLEITQKEQALQGEVNIGMPIEFGNNRIIPLLTDIGKKYENLQFNIQMDFASQLNEGLLAGDLDFAFVDEFEMDKRVITEVVAEEVFDLCASKTLLEKYGHIKTGKPYFEALDYVAYQEGEPVLRKWFSHHLKRKNLNLQVRARVMDVKGIARFIISGLGVGVLPDHLVFELMEQGHDLYVFKGSGVPLTNKISLSYLKNRSRSFAVTTVLNEIRALMNPA